MCPVVPVQLAQGDNAIVSLGYVDSGAFYSLFAGTDGDRLGIDWRAKPSINMAVGTGATLTAHLNRVSLSIGEETWEAVIGFSGDLRIGVNLIGRISIFERFVFCFNDAGRELTMTSVDEHRLRIQ